MILFNTSRFKNHMTYTSQTLRELPQIRETAPLIEKTERLAPKRKPQPRRIVGNPMWHLIQG
jgi:hypothetical protein